MAINFEATNTELMRHTLMYETEDIEYYTSPFISIG